MSSSTDSVAGNSDSPTCGRGKWWRSKTLTDKPARANSVAAVLPAGPPPITTASTFMVVRRLKFALHNNGA